MSCGHDGCTCGPEATSAATSLPMAERTTGPHASSDDHTCGGHGHGHPDRDGCCGGSAA